MPILTYSLHCFGIISANGLLTLRLHICHFVCVCLLGDRASSNSRTAMSQRREKEEEGDSAIGSKIYRYGRHWAAHLAGAS